MSTLFAGPQKCVDADKKVQYSSLRCCLLDQPLVVWVVGPTPHRQCGHVPVSWHRVWGPLQEKKTREELSKVLFRSTPLS